MWMMCVRHRKIIYTKIIYIKIIYIIYTVNKINI